MKKGCVTWIATIGEKETNRVSIHEVLIVNEFLDVFLKELPRLPPVREVEFAIDLKLGTEPISTPSYWMAPVELRDLKE